MEMVVTGDKRLNRKLARLAAKDAKGAVRKSSRTAIKPLAADFKKEAPRESGDLARATKVRSLPRSRQSVGTRVVVDAETLDKKYAAFRILGTERMEGDNYPARIAERKKQVVLNNYRRLLGKEITARAKRG